LSTRAPHQRLDHHCLLVGQCPTGRHGDGGLRGKLRAECPPDRARELRLATQRAAEAEQARTQALQDQHQAAEEVGALQGRLLHRRNLQVARERLVLAEHALKTTTSQADQAAERLGVLRRAQQRRLGWLEAHHEKLRLQERAVAREAAWRRRVDQRALALDPPGWLLAELGPVPADPRERAVWRIAAAELDGYRRAYGLEHDRPAKHALGRVAREGRAAPATAPAAERADATGGHREDRGHGRRAHRPGDRPHRPTVAADRRHRADPGRLLGAEPRRQAPGRRRDWQSARAALEQLAGWGRHRDQRDQRHPDRERPGRTAGRDLGHQERDGR
jgi:hypothetical protein